MIAEAEAMSGKHLYILYSITLEGDLFYLANNTVIVNEIRNGSSEACLSGDSALALGQSRKKQTTVFYNKKI